MNPMLGIRRLSTGGCGFSSVSAISAETSAISGTRSSSKCDGANFSILPTPLLNSFNAPTELSRSKW